MHLLLIEDNPLDARRLEEMLARGSASRSVTLIRVDRLSAALELLAQINFSAVLLDLDLRQGPSGGDLHGLEALRPLQAAAPQTPILALSASADEGLALQAAQAGAQDCLVKGRLAADVLLRAVRYAIERKRLELAFSRQTVELQALYDTLLEALVERAASLLNTPSAGLYLLQADNQSLQLSYTYNVPPAYNRTILRLGEGLAGRAALVGQPIAIEDHRYWEGQAASFARSDFRRCLGVPIKVAGKPIGVIILANMEQAGPWSAEEIRLASRFADQAAIAIQNALLLEAERRRSTELARSNAVIAALSQAASQLGETRDPARIQETIAAEFKRLGVTVLFSLAKPGAPGLTVSHLSAEPETLRELERLLGIPAIIGFQFPERFWDALGSGDPLQPAYLPDGLSKAFAVLPGIQPEVVAQALEHLGLPEGTPFLRLPLALKDRLVGLMSVWGGDLRSEDLPAFTVFSNHVAAALENARLYSHIERLATIDELTGLLNRRGFFMLGEQQLRVAQRAGSEVLLFFFDLDHLKQINDQYGHKAGDRALVELAEALRATFRSADIVARISGDEFAVLAYPTVAGGAGRLLARLQAELDRINAQAGHAVTLGFSAGFAMWSPARPASLDELLAAADSQMYVDKRSKTGPLGGYAS